MGEKSTAEQETRAAYDVATALENLDPDARTRVWIWAGQRYDQIPTPVFERGISIAGPPPDLSGFPYPPGTIFPEASGE